MNPQIFHDYIIFPTLQRMGAEYNSMAVRQLLLATAAQESHVGDYLVQVGGPALSPYQMEPATLKDLHENYLKPKGLLPLVQQFTSPAALAAPELFSTVGELFYATALARMNYRRKPGALPAFDDFKAMWAYYKKYWNSILGAATEAEFAANWKKYVAGVKLDDPKGRIKSPASVV